MISLNETCQQYVARRLSEGWSIVSRKGFNVILQSPDGNILRPVDLRNDVETLRPNAAGDETSMPLQFPNSTFHWDKVDEVTADEDSTYIYSSVSAWRRDLYNLPASSGSGTINSITIYFRVMGDFAASVASRSSQKSGGTVTDGTSQPYTTSYVTNSQTYNTNPATGGAYTWDEIDALQVGVSIDGFNLGYCTQVYVEIDYTLAPAPGGSPMAQMIQAGLV